MQMSGGGREIEHKIQVHNRILKIEHKDGVTD